MMTTSAPLPGKMGLRIAADLRCSCGGRVRCDPDATGGSGFRLICPNHHDVIVVERDS
jgi:hypothetical protein